MTRLLGVLVLLLVPLASLAQTQSPPTDWIDEFPSVTEVAHAAFEELKVTAAGSGVDPTDDDTIAVNLAGTFVMLRQLLFLKLQAEPLMAKERAEKLRKVFAAYAEAELTIGQGAAGRRGYITRGPPTGQGCRAQDQECYRRWFLSHLNANTSRAEYRQRVLNRLFPCGDRAKELNDFRQSFGLRTPYVPSPAVTLRIEPQIAGLAPAGCVAYGGDANRNGLCDDWERTPGRAASTATLAPAKPMELIELRMAKGGGLRVSIAKDGAKPGTAACFRVVRVEDPASRTRAQPFWSGMATIEAGADAKAPLVAHLARDKPASAFELVESHPVLRAEVMSIASRGPVHCEQPLKTWLPRHRTPMPQGLHGPYTNAREALDAPGAMAYVNTIGGEYEHGFLILRDTRPNGGYYATPPRRASQGLTGKGQPLFLPQDYARSFKDAFATSCEDAEHYGMAATVHTHPEPEYDVPVAFDIRRERSDYFSWEDFDQAIRMWQVKKRFTTVNFGGVEMPSRFERIVMISARTGCIQSFEPIDGDEPFEPLEITLLQQLAGLPRIVSDRYDICWKRQVQMGCYRPATTKR